MLDQSSRVLSRSVFKSRMFTGCLTARSYQRVTGGLTVNWSVAKDFCDQSASVSVSVLTASGFWQWDHDRVEVTLAAIHLNLSFITVALFVSAMVSVLRVAFISFLMFPRLLARAQRFVLS